MTDTKKSEELEASLRGDETVGESSREDALKDEKVVRAEPPSFSIDHEGYVTFRVHLSEGVYRIWGLIDIEFKRQIMTYFTALKKKHEGDQKVNGIIRPNGPIDPKLFKR